MTASRFADEILSSIVLESGSIGLPNLFTWEDGVADIRAGKVRDNVGN